MELLTRFTFESKIIPGVTAVFRRASATSRTRFLDSLATYRAAVRALYRERKPLHAEYQAAMDKAKAAAKVEVDKLIEAENIDRAEAEKRVPLKVDFPDEKFMEWAQMTDDISRAEREGSGYSMLRALLVSLDGLDGIATADQLIDLAPAELADELIDVARQISALSPTERGESPWPGTPQPAPQGESTAANAPAPVPTD